MSMENDIYSAPLGMAGGGSNVIDEISQHSTTNPLIQCYLFDLQNQTHIINFWGSMLNT